MDISRLVKEGLPDFVGSCDNGPRKGRPRKVIQVKKPEGKEKGLASLLQRERACRKKVLNRTP